VDWREAYYLSCLFHDIGTADSYLPQSLSEVDQKSKLSFEFKGGILAREFILNHGGKEDLADAICEVRFIFQRKSGPNAVARLSYDTKMSWYRVVISLW
jgi:hypothetical protein